MTRTTLLDLLMLIGVAGIAASVLLYAWQAVFGVVGVVLFSAGLWGRLKR